MSSSIRTTPIFFSAPFPMWIFDPDSFQFLAVNREAVKHYGYSEKEFLGMTVKDIRPEEDIPQLEMAVEIARGRTDQYNHKIHRHRKKNGSLINVQIKTNLINFEGKDAILAVAIDLTERIAKENNLKKHREYLRVSRKVSELLLKSDNWIDALDRCFHILAEVLEVNRIYYFHNNLLLNTTSQRLQWDSESSTSQRDNPKLQEIPISQFSLFVEPLRCGRHFEAIVSELPLTPTKKALAEKHIESILVLPVMVDGNFLGFVGLDDCEKQRKWNDQELDILLNLSSNLSYVFKELRAYQKLNKREIRFRALVKKGTDLISILDAEGIYKYVAPTSTKILGLPPEKYIGKSIFDLVYEEDVQHFRKDFDKVLAGDFISIKPYRYPDANGDWRWLRTEISNHLSDPNISGLVANTWDITQEMEKKIAEELMNSLMKQVIQPIPLADCLEEALKMLVELYGVCIGEVWLRSEDKSQINLISTAYNDNSFKLFHEKTLTIDKFDMGSGLPGVVWKQRKTEVWEDIQANKQFRRLKAAELVNIKTGIGIPLLCENEYLGSVICYSKLLKSELVSTIKLLTTVIPQLGAVVKQKIIEDQYKSFFNISPDPQCVFGFDGIIHRCNHAFSSFLGYDSSDIVGKKIFNFIHTSDREKAREIFRSLLNEGQINSVELRFQFRTGKLKWIIWSASVKFREKIIVAVAKEITEQKAAEEDLQLAYSRLKKAQQIAKVGYWVWSFDSDVMEWSDEMFSIHGFLRDNFIPTIENIKQTFHPEDKYLMEKDPLQTLTPNEIKTFENRILTSSGAVKWVRHEIILVLDHQGNPSKIEGVTQDITNSKEYEQQLTLSNERFNLAMKASNEMIWEIDHREQKIIHRNASENSFHYFSEKKYSKANSWYENIHPEDIDELWISFQKFLKNKKKSFWQKEYRLLKEDGSVSYINDRCYIIRDENGTPVRSIGSALDVTKSRKQLKRIQEQNKKLREIAWSQSHLVRAPLSNILGLIYLAKEHDGGGKSTVEILDLIANSANELDKVIHKIAEKTYLTEDEN